MDTMVFTSDTTSEVLDSVLSETTGDIKAPDAPDQAVQNGDSIITDGAIAPVDSVADAVQDAVADLEAALGVGETAESLVEADNGFKFEPANFVDNLRYMGLGMLGIFIVIGVIMGVTALLNKFFKD